MFVSSTLNWKECCEICCLNIVRSATEVKSDVLFYFSPCPYVCYCVTDHYIWCMSNNKIRERYHKKERSGGSWSILLSEERKLKSKRGNYVLQNIRMKERGIIIPINSLKEVKTSPNYIWTYVWNRVLLLYTSIYMSITKFLGILKDIKVF